MRKTLVVSVAVVALAGFAAYSRQGHSPAGTTPGLPKHS
jgi:hypothetical protein